jgi:hypothetical protein
MGIEGIRRACLVPTQLQQLKGADQLTRTLTESICEFSEHAAGLRLRSYQRAVAQAIINSAVSKSGLTFVVMFPRQSGKNEVQAHIETFLLLIAMYANREIVKVSPTWKPQAQTAMRRLERFLKRNILTQEARWYKESGYIYRIGSSRIYFLSGSPTANIVGATADLLLECDEAQDISIEKYDKEIAPMAASTNATRVFWGTAWTSKTLLARELRAARKAEKEDGIRRVFVLSADDVMTEVPAYGKFVQEQISKLGRNHPMVKTQYYSEEIDAEGGMFPRSRQALMQGSHERRDAPMAISPSPFGERLIYAFLIDVAGEDEGASDDPAQLENPKRDSTALTIVEVDLSTLDNEIMAAPTYKVMQRFEWIGEKHSALYPRIRALFELWQPRQVIIDSTGVGAGLASFFVNTYGEKVLPFLFTVKSKSDLGWSFLAVVETGRYKEYSPPFREGTGVGDQLHSRFWQQVEACQMNIKEGPNKILHWGVPDGTRDPATGDLIHDDLLISASMCALLDQVDWHITFTPMVVQARDPLADIDEGRF